MLVFILSKGLSADFNTIHETKMNIMKLILLVLSINVFLLEKTSAQPCPNDVCMCDPGDHRGRIIDCRNLGLTVIPHFNATDEVFWELTLTNNEGPNDPNAHPDGCSYCNKITSLPGDAFAGLNVKRLDLRKNALSSVAPDAFSGMEETLTELLLEGNRVAVTPYSALVNLTNLTLLSVEQFNQVSIEEENEYGNFVNLQTLELKHMQMTHISSRAFVGKLSKLTRLKLIDNPLLSFPSGALQQLSTLEYLAINQAQFPITSDGIPANAISKLQRLNELDLTANELTTLAQGCFNGTEEKLTILILQRNRLSDAVKLAPILEVEWRLLDQLNLAYNSIQSLPDGAFQKMPKLANLELAGNELTVVTANMFSGLAQMHSIDLTYNKIISIEMGAFTHMPLMEILNILEQNFSPTSKLNLNANSFQGLENSLKHLSLRKTKVMEDGLWSAIKPLSKLAALELQNTGLQSIPEFVFTNNKKISYLELSSNNISRVSQETFHGLRDSLTTLSLIDNKIETINRCVFDNFTRLEQLHLRDNPILCDCEMQWLYDWIVNHDNEFFGLQVVQCKCAGPPGLIDQQIQNVHRENLTCAENYTAAVCTNYYTTTTTTTTPAPTTIPMPILTVTAHIQTLYALTIEWTVSDATYITGFKLQYNKLGIADPTIEEVQLQTIDRTKDLSLLDTDTNYKVCVFVEVQGSYMETPTMCVEKKTAALPKLEAAISMETIDVITVAWTVNDDTYVTGFKLRYAKIGTNTPPQEVQLSKENHTKDLESLDENSSYNICIIADLLGSSSQTQLLECVEGSTIANPTLMATIAEETMDLIIIDWTISDNTYVTGFKLQYEKLGIEDPERKEERIHKADRKKVLEHLDTHSSYQICLNVEVQDSFRKSPRKCVVGKTLPPPTTAGPVTEKQTGLSQAQIGTIAGSVVGAVVFAILLAAILFILLKKRDESDKAPDAVVVKAIHRAPAPRVGYDSKRFTKPKKDKVSSTDPGDIKIKVISNGAVDSGDPQRVSAGSYQNLNTDTPHVNRDPMPSTSRDSDHYENSMDGRPLPRTPYYAVGPGHFNQAYHPDIPSPNHYDEIGIETGL